MATHRTKNHILYDVLIIVISILVAIDLAHSKTLENLLALSQESIILGSFVAGSFFTSVFTTAPAIVILGKLTQSHSILLVASIGAIGAMLGDFIIFRFVRDTVSEDLAFLIQKSRSERFLHIFHLRLFRWLIAFIGALIIASPLPDEIGLLMMGFSKLKMPIFLSISFIMNFSGILVIGLIARSLL